jgi:DnaJ family protein B protein 13
MGLDYYAILNVPRSAQLSDIHSAYRRLALKLHPDKNKDGKSQEELFARVAEAYEVLRQQDLRAIFDQFGEEGLKKGLPQPNGGWSKGYIFHGDANKTFKAFFGTDNPFADFAVPDAKKGTFGGKIQDPAIERELHLTLEELYLGCDKKMKISRHVMNEDGHTSSVRDKILSIRVKRGWKAGTRVTFKEEGDQGPNTIPADMVYILREREHALFQRQGDDLIYKAKIPLGQALVGCAVEVATLDGRLLTIPINDIVHQTYTKTVFGEGMPITGEDGKTGNLIIEFDIIFPEKLSPPEKMLIKDALLSKHHQLN